MAASDLDRERIGLAAAGAGNGAPGADTEDEGVAMTLVEHLEELRRRLLIAVVAVVVCSIIGFFFWDRILGFLLLPLPKIANGLTTTNLHGAQLVAHGIGEGFTVALKLSVAVGLAVASPVILYQVWGFIAPGLTRRERKYAAPFTVLGVALFALGIGVGFVVLRWPVSWLIDFGQNRFIYLVDANSYFSFVAFFLLAFGIVFEMPLVLTFLALVNVVNSRLLSRKRTYAWFGMWVASCFITPGADPYSPIIIGVAMTALYELSIVLMKIIGK
jgi:sec-independent protein translocase protein TatC